uniref:Serpentine receptor class gamma n=1 Tax=Steinernema glaseri TaxID=37863 RepID=A0A1I7Y2E1_9BILA
MEIINLFGGIIFLIITTVFSPIYTRIIYVLLALTYLYGAIYLAVLNTPWAGIITQTWMSSLDFSKPYSALVGQTTLMISMGSMWACLGVYSSVVCYLLYKRSTISKMSNYQMEKTILVNAVIHFIGDMFLVVGMYYIRLPQGSSAMVFLTILFLINYLILPPVLYLALYQSIRDEFIPIKLTNTVGARNNYDASSTHDTQNPA